ncbi:MAG: histidine phosphatase family protein [Aggregatilineales bacterium]
MTAPLTIHFTRHGEVHNPDAILYGRMPGYYLSETGKIQAQAAGTHLAGKNLAAIYCSPMERTQQTAGIIAEAHPENLTPQVDERLNESHTPFDGTSHEELEKTMFDIYAGSEPPYEQPVDIRRRVRDFAASMRIKHANQEIAAVSHGDILVLMFAFAVGQPEGELGRGKLMKWGLSEYYPTTAGIISLTYSTTDPEEIPAWAYHRPY